MSDDLDVLDGLSKKELDKQVRDFSDLLQRIEGVDDKKKQLWKEIYENAINDRRNAHIMFVKLANIASDKSNEHAVHGRTMAQFLERMGRANDQLIKLSELISQADPESSPIDSDDMFNKIAKKR